ncbi:MAG TPA: hypothetical protein VG055_07230 [Planctomycetaceae bacterium]|nr:hypothetical protein [Planctomycetaceae bacterium]
MRHGLGRKDSSPVLRAQQIARGLALFGLAAVPLLAAGRMIRAQDDPRDLIEERRRDVQRERRVVQQDLNRERRLDDREYGRPDPQALERRTKLYRDLKKDFIDFDKNGFDRGPDRRYHGGEPSAVVDTPETLDLVRRIFARIAEEADALQVGLNNDVDQIRGVRSVLHDVIEFSARAQVLAESCRRADRVGVLYGDFEAFDRDWQAISYKLRRIPDVNQTAAIKRVDDIDKLDQRLTDIFKIKPHFDQHELLRATAALADKLQRLAEDIGVEMVDPQLRRELTGKARRTQSEAQMVSDLVDSENDPAAVAGEFKEYLELWHPLARQIRQVDSNHALERTVFRITQSNREIAEFLRMPAQNDTSSVAYMMEAVKRDVDEYFTRAPLRLVMELPDSRTALVTAGEFYGLCEQFAQDANNNASQTDLAESFHNVSQAWRSFNHTFRPMNSEPARRVLNRIEEGMGSLANALQLYDQQFDGRRLSELAYALSAAADNIDRDTRIWLEHERPDFGEEAIRATHSFVERCQRFSDAVTGGATVEQLRPEIVNLYEHYKRVYGFISQCGGRERIRLAENAKRAKAALVDLRTQLEI